MFTRRQLFRALGAVALLGPLARIPRPERELMLRRDREVLLEGPVGTGKILDFDYYVARIKYGSENLVNEHDG